MKKRPIRPPFKRVVGSKVGRCLSLATVAGGSELLRFLPASTVDDVSYVAARSVKAEY
jgi:hypothetical protein